MIRLRPHLKKYLGVNCSMTLVFSALLGSISLAAFGDLEDKSSHLVKDFSLSCRGIDTFDFVLEAGNAIAEWCRKQNELLAENGCGSQSEMCLEEFIRADRPGKVLSFGIGASYSSSDFHLDQTDVVVGDSRWDVPPHFYIPEGEYSSQFDLNYERLQILFSVGLEFPLGARKVVRKTCVNPLTSPYLEMLTTQLVKSDPFIQDFKHRCNQ